MKVNKSIINRNNYRYYIDVKYEEYYPCQHGSNCCDGDCCRCGEITHTSAELSATDAYKIACACVAKKLQNTVQFFLLSMFIRHVIKSAQVDIGVRNGYYGQEIGPVQLDGQSQLKILSFLDAIEKDTPVQDLVEKVLAEEYGHVLPDLKNQEWQCDEINLQNIIPASMKHVDRNFVQQYKQVPGYLTCICKNHENNFSIIDGHHRYLAASELGHESMTVIYCGDKKVETKSCKEHPRYKATKKPRSKCGVCWAHYLSKNGLVAKSDSLDLKTVQAIEDVSDLSIELDGSVNLTFSKDGVVIIRDELDKKVILQLIVLFIEGALKNKEKEEE